MRIVRFRPGVELHRDGGSDIVLSFLGPFVPLSALRRRLIPVVPSDPRLVFQTVHTDDVATAFVRAIVDDSVRGAYNLAADPVIDAKTLAEVLNARPVPVPLSVMRLAVDVAYRARVQPTDAGWVDMSAAAPVMS